MIFLCLLILNSIAGLIWMYLDIFVTKKAEYVNMTRGELCLATFVVLFFGAVLGVIIYVNENQFFDRLGDWFNKPVHRD